jgi:hypothetical protein
LAYLRAELEAGRSVVLTGAYGIGRTSLVKHLALEVERDWHFAFGDFAQDPGAVWRDLFAAFFPKAQHRLRGRTRSVKWTRFRVANQRFEDRRRHVVVLDNLARLSPQRLDVARRMRERFEVVAIVEDFLPEPAKAALCSALWARPTFRIGHLSRAVTRAFFEECSDRWGLGWGAGEIHGLAQAVNGFPFGMREAVAAELRRRRGSWGSTRPSRRAARTPTAYSVTAPRDADDTDRAYLAMTPDR